MTISFQGCPFPERLLKSVWVTSEPPDSMRSRSPLRDETISNCPSGSQSKHIGNDGKLTLTITSLLPSRLTAIISCAPQSANHRRPSYQRGDSPNARPVNRVCISDMSRLLLFTRSQNLLLFLLVKCHVETGYSQGSEKTSRILLSYEQCQNSCIYCSQSCQISHQP